MTAQLTSPVTISFPLCIPLIRQARLKFKLNTPQNTSSHPILIEASKSDGKFKSDE